MHALESRKQIFVTLGGHSLPPPLECHVLFEWPLTGPSLLMLALPNLVLDSLVLQQASQPPTHEVNCSFL